MTEADKDNLRVMDTLKLHKKEVHKCNKVYITALKTARELIAGGKIPGGLDSEGVKSRGWG